VQISFADYYRVEFSPQLGTCIRKVLGPVLALRRVSLLTTLKVRASDDGNAIGREVFLV